ncbi:MAG: phage/plasmid primase, P4 family [Magnetococcus sp. YQC-5]
MGYSLLPTCRFERFALLIGSGANGKSVLLSVVEALVGREHVCAVQPSQFDNKFQRAHFHGKLANIVTEIAEGAEIADAQLKAIVSGELTTAEHKLKPPFEFHPVATCWFGTNHLPHTRDFSDALFRRAIILTFNNKFEGDRCDPNLARTLANELPGILILALAGAKRLLTNGRFTEPSSVQEMKTEWRRTVDQAAQFVEDVATLDPTKRTLSEQVWRRYQRWTEENGIKSPLNRNNLTARLRRLGVERARGTGGKRFLQGIDVPL